VAGIAGFAHRNTKACLISRPIKFESTTSRQPPVTFAAEDMARTPGSLEGIITTRDNAANSTSLRRGTSCSDTNRTAALASLSDQSDDKTTSHFPEMSSRSKRAKRYTLPLASSKGSNDDARSANAFIIMATESLLSQGTPEHRQEKFYRRHGIVLPDSTRRRSTSRRNGFSSRPVPFQTTRAKHPDYVS
jgi:hypothetical protein